jgi:hypothetical protein
MKKGVITEATHDSALARLREGGFVSRPSNFSGHQWTTVLEKLTGEGYLLERKEGRRGGVALVSEPSAVVRHRCGEKPAEPPLRVKCKSSVFGPGSDSSTSPQVAKEEPVPEPAISPDCNSASVNSSEPLESAVETASGLTEPLAARDDDTAAPAPAVPPQLHAPAPFAGKAMDWELYVIGRCISHIEMLPEAARARVAAYVASRYL